MKKLIKHKKALIIIGSIIIIILLISPVTNIYCTLKFKKSKVININSEFEVINDELYEITPEGEYYFHTFNGKPEKISNTKYNNKVKENIISFLKYSYLDKNISKNDLEKTIESKNYSFTFNNISYIENGKLYVMGANSQGQLGLGHDKEVKEFTLVKSIPSVKKVCLKYMGYDRNIILTNNYELFACYNENWPDKNNNFNYTKLDFDNKIIDIYSNRLAVIALDDKGYTHVIWQTLYYNPEYNNIKQIYANSNSTIFFALTKDEKKFTIGEKNLITEKECGILKEK